MLCENLLSSPGMLVRCNLLLEGCTAQFLDEPGPQGLDLDLQGVLSLDADVNLLALQGKVACLCLQAEPPLVYALADGTARKAMCGQGILWNQQCSGRSTDSHWWQATFCRAT